MSARLLGDFTPEAPEQAEDLAFGWFGATIRTGPEFGDLAFTDWAEEFSTLEEDDARGAYANKVLWRRLLNPEDFEQFWSLAIQHGQQSEDLARLFAALNKAILKERTGRPTQRPGDSSPGPTTAPTNSPGTSFEPGSAVSAAAERAVAKLEGEGRPDLALLVTKAQEQLSA